MPATLYSYKLRREVLMLSEEEYLPIAAAPHESVESVKRYRRNHNVSVIEAKHPPIDGALEYYRRLTGVRLSAREELYWVRLSRYGRVCPECGKPFRTPQAKLCVECGFELPAGETAGPAEPPRPST